MTVLFLHGWQSKQGSVKPTFQPRHGHTVLNPKLSDTNFDEPVRIGYSPASCLSSFSMRWTPAAEIRR